VTEIIMVPTVGSEMEEEAINVATKLSDIPGSELKLVRVYSAPMVYTGPDTIDYPASAIASEREWAHSQLDAIAANCASETRASVSTAFEEGRAPDALNWFARSNRVSLIVMSSHCRGGFARVALGSVTDSLIRSTNIPVLVVKPSASYRSTGVSRPFRRILVPLDGSTLAEEIIPNVIDFARRNDSAVILSHVLVPTNYPQKKIPDPRLPWWEDDVQAAQAYLGEQAERVRREGVPATVDIIIGETVAEGITRSASRLKADLIAIATRGRGGMSRLVRGSVADKVVRTARVSLLVVHPREIAVAAGPARSEVARSGDGLLERSEHVSGADLLQNR
jgi:nucleotide-binding universal stress UspA family protein